MTLKINIKSLEWWYWLVTLIAMVTGLSGIADAFYAVIIISAVQCVHFTILHGFVAFPTQVRFVYALFVIIALFDPSQIFYWALLIGTLMVTLFDTCFIARVLILMPWNKHVKLS